MARKNEIRYVNFYMTGSAAYQVHSAENKKSVKLPKAPKKQKKVIYLDPLTMIGYVVAFVMIISMTVGVVSLSNASREAARMEQYAEQLKQENAQLEAQYRDSYDLDEIRAYADAMGLVPIEQVEHIQISVVEPPAEAEPTAWEEFWIFLTGLFA